MHWVFWLVAGAAVIGLLVIGRRRSSGSRRKPVLPAHYDPTNYYVDPATIPGRCVHCETMNDPDYRFCENCSEKLPEIEHVPSRRPDSLSFGRN